ncbi:MAG: LPS export ABC transporter periplasmic protein LptC [Armatimonadota bacterium]
MPNHPLSRIAAAAFGFAALLPFATGCNNGGGKDQSTKKPSPSPSAKASPAGIPLEAQISDIDLTLLDENGRTIVQVTAKAGAVGPGQPGKAGAQPGGVVGSLSGGTAVLYQEGKPTAKLTADSVRAEQESRTVVARGNATVTSLADPSSPAIRADTMTWRYDTGTITGVGNVLITRKPDLRVPGKSFSANTRLNSFTLNGGAGPATATF